MNNLELVTVRVNIFLRKGIGEDMFVIFASLNISFLVIDRQTHKPVSVSTSQ